MITLGEASEEFLLDCRDFGLRPATIRWYVYMLKPFIEPRTDADLEETTRRDVKGFLRERTEDGLSPYSIRGHIRALKRFFTWCIKEGLIDESPMGRIREPKVPRKKPKAISLPDVRRLLATCGEEEPIDARDRAIITLLIDTGCRVSGLTGLDLDDVDTMRAMVSLEEKDGPRFAPLTGHSVRAVRAWVAARPDYVTRALFVNMNHDLPLGYSGVREMLQRRAERAGVTGPHNPHAFRHAFAREYLLNGGDTATLAEILGHTDPSVTRRYYAIFTIEDLRHPHHLYSPAQKLAQEA